MRRMLVLGAALSLGGCATMARGSDEKVEMNSEPAGAAVRTDIGLSCPATPCTIEVPRKSAFMATFTKEGFKDVQVAVGTKIDGGGGAGLAGSALAGGLIGVGVDAATGAAMNHDPNPVIVKLEPLTPAPANIAATGKNKTQKSTSKQERMPGA